MTYLVIEYSFYDRDWIEVDKFISDDPDWSLKNNDNTKYIVEKIEIK